MINPQWQLEDSVLTKWTTRWDWWVWKRAGGDSIVRLSVCLTVCLSGWMAICCIKVLTAVTLLATRSLCYPGCSQASHHTACHSIQIGNTVSLRACADCWEPNCVSGALKYTVKCEHVCCAHIGQKQIHCNILFCFLTQKQHLFMSINSPSAHTYFHLCMIHTVVDS